MAHVGSTDGTTSFPRAGNTITPQINATQYTLPAPKIFISTTEFRRFYFGTQLDIPCQRGSILNLPNTSENNNRLKSRQKDSLFQIRQKEALIQNLEAVFCTALTAEKWERREADIIGRMRRAK